MKESVVIVAFGDSLTAGYQSPLRFDQNPTYTPYTDTFKSRLEEVLKRRNVKAQVEILNKGVCGDLTSDLLLRINRDVLKIKPDVVIILGGSNDIGWGIPVEEVYSNLKQMYEAVLEAGIKLIVCTVPSIDGFDPLIPPRKRLNELLIKYCKGRGVVCVDLFTATSDPETERLSRDYSHDGLHLTEEGYRKMGDEIYATAGEEILSIISYG